MKPGWKTSEFYTALAGLVVGGLVLFGVVTNDQAQTLNQAVALAVEAVAGLIVALVPVWKYIDSRTRVKEAAISAGVPQK